LDEFVQRQQSESLIIGSQDDSKDGFLWEVYVPHYLWRNESSEWFSNATKTSSNPSVGLLGDNGEACSYTRFSPSSLAKEIARNVIDYIRQYHNGVDSYGLFHIRRGDSRDACDTSLPEIQKYLNCSFHDRLKVSSHFGRIAILLASDERDPQYRSAIATLITEGLGYDFVDLDETIQTVLKQMIPHIDQGRRSMNNMYSYHISRLVAEDPQIKFVLEKRRTIHCPDCTQIVEESNIVGSPHVDTV